LNIGYILHSINVQYNDLWHYFSMKWENYKESDCDIAWNSFSNNEQFHTIHNLIYLANMDNPSACKELTVDIPNHDLKYLRPFDNVISKLVYRLYGEKFVCSNPEKNEWFHFNENRWVKENKSYNLRKIVITDVFEKVEDYRKRLVKDCADEEIIKNYHIILKTLGSGIKLNCLELEFYNSDFYKIIDQNKNILGFDNGVLDLTTMEFRKGVSSDYISMSVGYEYKQTSKAQVAYITLMNLIKDILPDKPTRDFTLKALASCLDGHTIDENFYIFSGKSSSGGNGKSTIVDLTMKALGEYAYTAPVSLFTSKRESANNANSALMGIMNKRMIVMQEPEVNDVIQAGIMKGLTGGDKISTRELHASQIEFKPHGKFFICCNKIPSISDIDGGVVRRLKITEFTSRFVDNPTETTDGVKEFKIDRDIKSKLDDYAPIFMSILVDYYTLYKKEGLDPPEPVQAVTKKYENDNNAIKYFIDENIVKNKDGVISREELKDLYKADFTIKSSFKRFIDFLKQFEISTNTEFKIDKKRVYKIQGYSIKTEIYDSDLNDNDNDNDVDNDNDNDFVVSH
jgi:P4 family phage/plasmid primase-like protien